MTGSDLGQDLAGHASDHASDDAANAGEVTDRPYAPGWVDILTRRLERLPGPTWLAYVGLAAVAVPLAIVGPAVSGLTDPGSLAAQAFWGFVLPLALWLAHHLAGVAGDAFDAFRPALTASGIRARRLRYEITVTPARAAAILLAFSALLTPVYYVADPVASGIVGLSPIGLLLRYVSEVFFGALLLVITYQSIRQLRAVTRIHATDTRVDLFRPGPLYAFSVLTSRTAMVIALAFTVPTLVAAAPMPADRMPVMVAPWLVMGIVAAIAVFVMPLRGMQGRIVAEKRHLQSEVGLRIERTIDAIHERIDHDDMAGAGSMQGALNVLLVERDLIEKLPTLPWRPGTVGGLFTAVGLPLALFVVTRLIDRLI